MFCKRLSLRFAVPAFLSKLLYSELKSLKINRRICLFKWMWVQYYCKIHRGYYTGAWRYEFYFRVAKQYCFCHEKIIFISSSRRVMFFLLYRENDIDKIIEGNYQNYVTDKHMCEIMENKPLGRVPDVVFMNFTSTIFFSKTLVSI